jgi:heat shock protein HtpX
MATTYTNITSNKTKTTLWIVFFLSFVILLGYVLGQALDINWLFPFAIILALFQGITTYWWSDKIALAVAGAHEVSKKEAPELYRLVENLSITAGIPTPKVYIVDDESPNAFATGRDPKHASIAVTRGLLEKLNKPELEGVLAHEFSHIGNYDILLSTAIVVLVGIVVLISNWFFRISLFGGGRRSNNNDSGGIFMIIGLALALLSPLFATLIQLAISRKREFLADASGALLTRNPNELANALQKITADPDPLIHANNATAHLYFSEPLKDAKGKNRNLFANLFSTHPDPAERIKRLREMAM